MTTLLEIQKAAPAASVLVAALQRKHSDAVFVSECKDGPTQTRESHRRLDAWVLLKTWSPITTIGYEVKVTRSDWRRDEKLTDYMALCHQLYIVAPKGVVPIEELPSGVGLIESVGDQYRLVTRRKAARRRIDMPVELLVYVLMCRAKITRERDDRDLPHWRVEALRRWLAEKDDDRTLSYAVNEKLKRAFDKQGREIEETRSRIKQLEHIEARIREFGFDPNEHSSRWKVLERLSQISGSIPDHLLNELSRLSDSILRTRQQLSDIKAAPALALGSEDR